MSSTVFLLKNIDKYHDLQKIVKAQDHVVLLSDSTLLDESKLLALKTSSLYILESETALFSENPPNIFKILSYDSFATLLLQNTQCISIG